jgi:streptogramin lyase
MIVEGPDGNMWFTEEAGNKVGRIPIDIATAKAVRTISVEHTP